MIHAKKALNDFSLLIKTGNLHDVSLTIYHVGLDSYTNNPLSVDDLVEKCEQRIVISGSKLQKRIDLLNQLGSAVLTPVEEKSSFLDARIYYVFENEKNGKILDVAMWGCEGSTIVNGDEVKSINVFYDVILPFLSEDEVKSIEKKTTRRRGMFAKKELSIYCMTMTIILMLLPYGIPPGLSIHNDIIYENYYTSYFEFSYRNSWLPLITALLSILILVMLIVDRIESNDYIGKRVLINILLFICIIASPLSWLIYGVYYSVTMIGILVFLLHIATYVLYNKIKIRRNV